MLKRSPKQGTSIHAPVNSVLQIIECIAELLIITITNVFIPKTSSCRSCRFGYGTESEPNNTETPGKEFKDFDKITFDRNGIKTFIETSWI